MWRITGYSSVIPLPPRMSRHDACDLERRAHVVALDQAHVRRPELLLGLQACCLEGHELHIRDLRQHLGELGLHELVRRDRLAGELHAVLRVVDGAVEARRAPRR